MAAWGEDFLVLLQGPAAFEVCGPYAVVDICGPLAQKPNFQLDDYDSIRSRVAAALASEAEAVVLRIDSPGGDFPGSLEASAEIKAMATASGKRLICFTETRALSAGYGLAIACSDIVITPSAYVGSIGVWAALVDQTAADKAMGQIIRIVPSGSRKADRNPHVAMTEDTVNAMQAEVDAMAQMFFASVAAARNKPVAAIEAIQGAEVFGVAAVKAGLADRVVGSWSEFLKGSPTRAKSEDSMADWKKEMAHAAADGDEDAKKAMKALDSDGDKDGDKAKAASDEETEKKAKAEADEKEKAKAAAEDDKKKETEKEAAKASGNAALFAMTARVHALESRLSAKAEADERTTLLATRPDFSKEVQESLAGASLDLVKRACKTWPRITHGAPNAAASAGGTQGSHSASGNPKPKLSEEEAVIAKAMGGEVQGTGITSSRGGLTLELGHMTSAQAAAKLAELTKEGGR